MPFLKFVANIARHTKLQGLNALIILKYFLRHPLIICKVYVYFKSSMHWSLFVGSVIVCYETFYCVPVIAAWRARRHGRRPSSSSAPLFTPSHRAPPSRGAAGKFLLLLSDQRVSVTRSVWVPVLGTTPPPVHASFRVASVAWRSSLLVGCLCLGQRWPTTVPLLPGTVGLQASEPHDRTLWQSPNTHCWRYYFTLSRLSHEHLGAVKGFSVLRTHCRVAFYWILKYT